MKEIKAYLRPEILETTIQQLEKNGARDMTVIRVDAFGLMAEFVENSSRYHRKYFNKYSSVVKLEIVCRDDEVKNFVDIIKKYAYTGAHGDGRIFVSDVIRSINIRTREEGEIAL